MRSISALSRDEPTRLSSSRMIAARSTSFNCIYLDFIAPAFPYPENGSRHARHLKRELPRIPFFGVSGHDFSRADPADHETPASAAGSNTVPSLKGRGFTSGQLPSRQSGFSCCAEAPGSSPATMARKKKGTSASGGPSRVPRLCSCLSHAQRQGSAPPFPLLERWEYQIFDPPEARLSVSHAWASCLLITDEARLRQ